MNSQEQSVNGLRLSGMSARPLVDRTRRVYDRLASVYALSTRCFTRVPTAAHWKYLALATALVILEVATGSGEIFRRLVLVVPQKERKAFFHGLLTD